MALRSDRCDAQLLLPSTLAGHEGVSAEMQSQCALTRSCTRGSQLYNKSQEGPSPYSAFDCWRTSHSANVCALVRSSHASSSLVFEFRLSLRQDLGSLAQSRARDHSTRQKVACEVCRVKSVGPNCFLHFDFGTIRGHLLFVDTPSWRQDQN